MMTHHVVHESFRIIYKYQYTEHSPEGAILFSGGQMPPLAPLNATLIYIRDAFRNYVEGELN